MSAVSHLERKTSDYVRKANASFSKCITQPDLEDLKCELLMRMRKCCESHHENCIIAEEDLGKEDSHICREHKVKEYHSVELSLEMLAADTTSELNGSGSPINGLKPLPQNGISYTKGRENLSFEDTTIKIGNEDSEYVTSLDKELQNNGVKSREASGDTFQGLDIFTKPRYDSNLSVTTQFSRFDSRNESRRRRRRSRRKEKRKEYGLSMTIHGLSKILHGDYSVERIAWCVLLATGFVMAVVVTWGLWKDFFDNRVNTVYTKYKEVSAQLSIIQVC